MWGKATCVGQLVPDNRKRPVSLQLNICSGCMASNLSRDLRLYTLAWPISVATMFLSTRSGQRQLEKSSVNCILGVLPANLSTIRVANLAQNLHLSAIAGLRKAAHITQRAVLRARPHPARVGVAPAHLRQGSAFIVPHGPRNLGKDLGSDFRARASLGDTAVYTSA